MLKFKKIFATLSSVCMLTTGCALQAEQTFSVVAAQNSVIIEQPKIIENKNTQAIETENINSQAFMPVFSPYIPFSNLELQMTSTTVSKESKNNFKKEHEALEVFDEEIDYGEIKPNESGQIMIIMFHGLVEKKPHPPYLNTIEDFKEALQKLYDNGFRVVTLKDLIDNNIKVEAGYSPVVLTFDDGLSTAFSFVKDAEGNLVPKENCAVDIMQKFSKEHPDFGSTALFGINGITEPFSGEGTVQERLEYLVKNGYEIANHTFSHKDLATLSEERVNEEIAKQEQFITSFLPDYDVTCLIYPYGKRPKKEFRNYALEGEHEGTKYKYAVALREGQSGASATPGHIQYDPLNMPRVRGSDSDKTDLGWMFNYFKENPDQKYISDGNPNKISIPKGKEDRLNLEVLKEKEIVIYE